MYITGNKGFTLIELLVVIAIIGILSAVVLTSLNSSRIKAQDARAINNVKQVAIAMELARSQADGNYVTATSSLSSYLNPFPAEVYWVDNTADSSIYCVFAVMNDTTEGNYYIATEYGSNYITAGSAPAAQTDCDP